MTVSLRTQCLAILGLAACLCLPGCGKPHIKQAILTHDVSAVEKILKTHPKQVNQRDDDGDTMLHLAAQTGDEQMALVLVQNGADVDARNSDGETAIEVAAGQGSAAVMRTLLRKGAGIPDPRKLLRRAAWGGHVEVAELLLKEGADINVSEDEFKKRSTPLHAAVMANRPDMVEFLIARGADVNATDSIERTPLHLAAESIYTQIAGILLDHGSKVNAVSQSGELPIHRAAVFGRIKMIELLKKRGAALNAAASDGRTPFDMAALEGKPEAALLIRALGGNPSQKWELFDAVVMSEPESVAKVLAARPSSAAEILNGETALHFAVRHARKEIVEMLIAGGTDVNIRGYVKQTPLHVAARKANKEMIEYLLDRGAEINARDKDGETPLRYLYKFRSPVKSPGKGPVPLEDRYKPAEELLISKGGEI